MLKYDAPGLLGGLEPGLFSGSVPPASVWFPRRGCYLTSRLKEVFWPESASESSVTGAAESDQGQDVFLPHCA